MKSSTLRAFSGAVVLALIAVAVLRAAELDADRAEALRTIIEQQEAAKSPQGSHLPRRTLVPGEQARQEAFNEIETILPDEFAHATTKQGKLALAQKLLKVGAETLDDPTVRYVMFTEGGKLAIEVGDTALAFESCDAVSSEFDVDAWGLRLKTFTQLAATDKSNDLVEFGLGLVQRAIDEDRYDAANELATAVMKLAGVDKEASASLRDRVRAISDRASRLAQSSRDFQAALEKLKSRPDDADANLAVGRFLCFAKGDWKNGLLFLAHGGDNPLKRAAARDLETPTEAEGQKTVADGWWELGEQADAAAKDAMRSRACFWYGQAAPGLTGVARLQVQKRLGEQPSQPPGIDVKSILGPEPFAYRSARNRKLLLQTFGGTEQSERAVTAALYWIAKHQSKDGSWSLQQYVKQCTDKSCTGPGGQESLSAATAMGLLPYLAAGQTHASASPFQRVLSAGVSWLVSHQQPDGDLSAKADSQMYSHGMATIALCEDYGISRDRSVGVAAQRAIQFIHAAQNTKTGGWRYHPGEEGDTSVVGWQFMALKSAQMAGLQVNPAVLDGARKWLASVANGGAGNGGFGVGQFSYQPEGGPTPPMSAAALLCCQYLHVDRHDPAIVGGARYLMANQPDLDAHNLYYWYYATQVMHNLADMDWETWNGKMRTILVDSQTREGCAAGSWDPDKPRRDAWGAAGGRLMTTSLSCLTLEIYYRYLPLYVVDQPNAPATRKMPPKD